MATVPTLPGIKSQMISTSRLKQHVLTSGPESGYPVVFVHGNFSAATYFEELMLSMPDAYRCIAPD
ncbi:MAG: alpha/beta fold hydrolase, partial [Anaerolineales bacterium]